MTKGVERVHFETSAGFLAEAQRLVREMRVHWPAVHQLGHNVSKAESEQVIFWARTANMRPDIKVPDRWLVWGPGWTKTAVRVVAEVVKASDGDNVLRILSAFEEDRTFGS